MLGRVQTDEIYLNMYFFFIDSWKMIFSLKLHLLGSTKIDEYSIHLMGTWEGYTEKNFLFEERLKHFLSMDCIVKNIKYFESWIRQPHC